MNEVGRYHIQKQIMFPDWSIFSRGVFEFNHSGQFVVLQDFVVASFDVIVKVMIFNIQSQVLLQNFLGALDQLHN